MANTYYESPIVQFAMPNFIRRLVYNRFAIIYLVFKRGYDPDNITGPALATFGDMITMLCIFVSAVFVEVVL